MNISGWNYLCAEMYTSLTRQLFCDGDTTAMTTEIQNVESKNNCNLKDDVSIVVFSGLFVWSFWIGCKVPSLSLQCVLCLNVVINSAKQKQTTLSYRGGHTSDENGRCVADSNRCRRAYVILTYAPRGGTPLRSGWSDCARCVSRRAAEKQIWRPFAWSVRFRFGAVCVSNVLVRTF